MLLGHPILTWESGFLRQVKSLKRIDWSLRSARWRSWAKPMALTMWSRSVKRVESLGDPSTWPQRVFGNPWESVKQAPRIHPENRTVGHLLVTWVMLSHALFPECDGQLCSMSCSNQGIAGQSRANSGAPRLCWRWEKLLVKRTSRNTSAASRNPAGFGCWRRWLPLLTGECWVLWKHVETSGSKFYDNMTTARWSQPFVNPALQPNSRFRGCRVPGFRFRSGFWARHGLAKRSTPASQTLRLKPNSQSCPTLGNSESICKEPCGAFHFPSMSHPFPIHVPSISHPCPIHFPSMSHPFPIHFPSMSHPFPIHVPSISHPFPIHFRKALKIQEREFGPGHCLLVPALQSSAKAFGEVLRRPKPQSKAGFGSRHHALCRGGVLYDLYDLLQTQIVMVACMYTIYCNYIYDIFMTSSIIKSFSSMFSISKIAPRSAMPALSGNAVKTPEAITAKRPLGKSLLLRSLQRWHWVGTGAWFRLLR